MFRYSSAIISFILLIAALPDTAFAIDNLVVNGLRRGCLFAYYPDDNKIYFKIDFSRERITPSEAKQVDIAPVFSEAPPDTGYANIDIEWAVEEGKHCSSVKIILTEKGSSTPILETNLPVKAGISDEVVIDDVKLNGVYEVHFTLNGLSGAVTLSKPLERRKFGWEGNNLGVSDEIYPPFEPVTVKGKVVSVVLRNYTMNGFGLWDKVVSQGTDILDSAVTIRFISSSVEGKWKKQTVNLDKKSSNPQNAVFISEAVSEPVKVSAVSTIEMDGCMKVEMNLMPGEKPSEIQKLWLDIPLKDSEAPLFHEVSDYIRHNYSGYTPAGKGIVWDSTRSQRTAQWCNPFTSYIWLGGVERGLCWFAENDRGWINEKGDNAKPLQEIVREGKRLSLRIYLINKPVVIKEVHSLVFGMQTSPTKPMEENWRAKTITMPGGSGPVNPWSGLHCGYKGPYRGDWQIVDKIIEAQKSGVFDEKWFKEYVEKYNPPPAYGSWNWFDSVRYFSGLRRRPVMTYQEELIQSVVQPEWQTFQDQWRNAGTLGTEMSGYTQRKWFTDDIFRGEDAKNKWSNPSMYVNYPESYCDYGCWYVNEWFKRGVSAYWDNTFAKYSYNTRNSAAYITDDGKIQPAMVYWNEREYMKRVWNLLQYWRRNQPDPLEWSHHMTNALILPFESWATVILDYEQGADKPFVPEMHRAEATGRQVGVMAYWLFTPVGSNNPLFKEALKKNPQANGRPDWGMKMVHETLRSEYTGGSSLVKGERVGAPELEKIIVDFGYTKPGTTVYNYWDDEPAISIDNDNIKWILLSNSEEKSFLIVLQSWDEKEITVQVKLNKKVLNYSDGINAADAENRKSLSGKNGAFSVDLPGPYGTRLINLK